MRVLQILLRHRQAGLCLEHFGLCGVHVDLPDHFEGVELRLVLLKRGACLLELRAAGAIFLTGDSACYDQATSSFKVFLDGQEVCF